MNNNWKASIESGAN